jgi:hypothetical protein
MQAANPGEPRAIRLMFSYEGDVVTLTHAEPVAMLVPPTDSLDHPVATSGFWLELHDADGTRAYRLRMHDPLVRDVEIFPEEPGGEIVRHRVDRPHGVFTAVVPDLPEARQLVLASRPAGRVAEADRASEIARFDLTDALRHERKAPR